jgi:FkbM family methyltransferase
LEIRLPPHSLLYREGDGETLHLPLDNVIAPFVIDHRQWQTEELEFIAAHAPQTRCVLVDAGANAGLITRQLLHRLPEIAAAVCFEPHPGNFQYLMRNLAHLPQCRAINAALGPERGELRFYEELGNAGNYSLNVDAMRGRAYRISVVQCIQACEAEVLSSLEPALQRLPLIWKSDTQGFDELIMTSLEDSFWSRVECGVMEIWRIERPRFDRARLAAILSAYSIRRFGDDPLRDVSVREILEFSEGADYKHRDLFFAR